MRRHYFQAFTERVAAFFPATTGPRRDYQGRGSDYGGRRSDYRGEGRGERGRDNRRQPVNVHHPIPISDRLRRSTLIAGRAALPLREVVLVMTFLNHPELIARHLDDFAHLDLGNAELGQLHAVLLEAAAHGEAPAAAELRQTLASGRFAALIKRLDFQIEACGHWPVMANAADRDAEHAWLQALTLHRRQRTLHKELKDAEAALAGEPSNVNHARLVDIQNQLASTEGTEALIEGFGSSSGRPARVL